MLKLRMDFLQCMQKLQSEIHPGQKVMTILQHQLYTPLIEHLKDILKYEVVQVHHQYHHPSGFIKMTEHLGQKLMCMNQWVKIGLLLIGTCLLMNFVVILISLNCQT